MKTPERFDRAIKALVTAFFDETLAKGSCQVCAVGNIIAASIGYRPRLNEQSSPVSGWGIYIIREFERSQENIPQKVLDNIQATGYLKEELALIERAFESATSITLSQYDKTNKEDIMKDQFNGLMAVVDVLCEIDGLDATPYKKMFEYNEELQPVLN